jgi:hypothetical protein
MADNVDGSSELFVSLDLLVRLIRGSQRGCRAHTGGTTCRGRVHNSSTVLSDEKQSQSRPLFT